MSIKKATVNIKDLPETLQVTDGDYFVVEQLDGTYILDYANFILEPEKTAISTLVYSHSDDIEALSAAMNAELSALSAYVEANMTKVYIGKATVTVDSGTYNSAFLSPRPTSDVPEITPTDFIITPANASAGRFAGYISFVDDSTDNRGFFSVAASFFSTILVANTANGEVVSQTNPSTAEELGFTDGTNDPPEYNVVVIKTY